MLSLRGKRSAMRDPRVFAAVLAFAVVVLPPIMLGPWLPLHDLVAFAALGAQPAQHTFGPLHFGVFQFTYIGHYAISRVLTALGLPAASHILIFYVLQAGLLFAIIWRLLVRFVPERVAGASAVALGALAFWDGQFLWGGPLPFSLASIGVAAATCLVLAEADRRKGGGPWVTLLLFLSLLCHPFALPFALLISALRLWFVPDRRWQTAASIGGLMLCGWVVAKDSPEADVVQGLFTITLAQFPARLHALFVGDAAVTQYLFGFVPAMLRTYFWVLGALHLAGFVLSPVVALRAPAESSALRMLAILNTTVGLMYFLTPGLESVMPNWPQRILTHYSPFTYVAAVVALVFVFRRRPASPEAAPHAEQRPAAAAVSRWLGFAAPVVILAWLLAAQLPILRLAEGVRVNFERIRDQLLATNVANAFVMTSDLNQVNPVFLRSTTFLLFSDPQVLARKIQFFTEWHIQPRHPTRLAEAWFDLGRPRLQAQFSSDANGVSVRLSQPPAGQPPVPRNNNALDDSRVGALELSIGNELYRAGCFADAIAHYRAAVRLWPASADARHNLGAALYQIGQPQEALAQFQAAARQKPDYADAHRNAGILLLEFGRRQDAALSFETALRLNPNDAAAREGLQRARE